jgi:hypothetical protein
MQKKMNLFFILTLFILSLSCFQEAFAAPVGGASANMDEVYCVGTLIGFAFAFAGFVILLMKGSNYGIFMIIVGISVTAFPGLINAFIEGISTASSEANDMTIGACVSGELPAATAITRDGAAAATFNPMDALTRSAPPRETTVVPPSIEECGPDVSGPC